MAFDFDVVVVGSSPLLMLYALQAKRAGKSVSMVESKPTLGGAWSLDRYTLDTFSVTHENACHLIEWYDGGYELLEHISGTPFEVCDPQPVKVWSDGRVAPYTSRMGIVGDYLATCRSIGYNSIKVMLSLAGIRYARGNALYQLRRSVARLVFETRHRLPGVIGYGGVCAPRGGFAGFVEDLIAQVGKAGITVWTIKATAATQSTDGSWKVQTCDGRSIEAAQVVVGESCSLATLNGASAPLNQSSHYHHVLVSLPAGDTLIRNSYVHFPDHPLFHRITFVEDVVGDSGAAQSIFLLQLRAQLKSEVDLHKELSEVCSIYGIATTIVGLEVLKSIDAAHVSSTLESGWRDYRENGPVVLKTIGDLSQNAIANSALLLARN